MELYPVHIESWIRILAPEAVSKLWPACSHDHKTCHRICFTNQQRH